MFIQFEYSYIVIIIIINLLLTEIPFKDNENTEKWKEAQKDCKIHNIFNDNAGNIHRS